MRRNPLIIGGGPAGTAAAITLGRSGWQPVLVERSVVPTDKVCGDFLSADAMQQAQALGINPSALGAAPIHRIRLIHGERTAEAALPFPAIGLSRRTLDSALLHQAERAGAVVRTGQTVRHLTRDPRTRGDFTRDDLNRDPPTRDDRTGDPLTGDDPTQEALARDPLASIPFVQGGLARDCLIGAPQSRILTIRAPEIREGGQWTALTGDKTAFTAETVFLATGKHDLRDLPRVRADRGAIGMKMYLAPAPGPAKALEGVIELTLFPGGYAGIQHVENGQVVLCIAVHRRAFQRYGGSWPGLIAAIGRHSRRFTAMLAGAHPLLPRPLAVAGIPYGYQVRSMAPDGLFRLGDQAAVIASLTGDGVAIALHTGKTAAETWLAGADSTAYHRALTRTLAPQMRLATLLHRACMSAPVQTAVIRGAAMFPALLRRAAGHTRLRSDP